MADSDTTTVIAFRVPTKDAAALDTKASSDRIVDVRSGNQFARKLVLDFLKGRLIYPNARHRYANPNSD